MNCGDCILGTGKRRVVAFMKSGGKRLYLPAPDGFTIAEIVEFRPKSLALRLRDLQGNEINMSPCSIPLAAFAGVS